jgi:molybdate transport system substrate-binding protein
MNTVCLSRLKQLSVILLCFWILSCRQTKDNKKITLFVAASLTEVVDSLANFYCAYKNVDYVINAASSGTLAKQIELGAPAAIYFSANTNWVNYLLEKGIISDTCYKQVAGNMLVLVSSKNDSIAGTIHSLFNDIVKKRNKCAIGTPAYVPAGKYAKEALTALGVFSDMEFALIHTKDVRAALILAEMGEVEYAIVYKTDALRSKKVKMINVFADSLYSPIVLSAGLIETSNKNAKEFYRFLSSQEAKKIFKYYGFDLPN